MRKVLVVLGFLALNGCWWQSGHDAGRSYWNDFDTTITPDNVDELERLWETAGVGGYTQVGASDGGQIYVTNGNQVTAIGAATGDVRWSTDLPAALGFSPGSGFAITGTPVVVAGKPTVPYSYAIGVSRFDVATLDPATGTTPAAGQGAPGGHAAQPAVVDDVLIRAGWGWLGQPGASTLVAQIGWTFSPTLFMTNGGPRPGEFAIAGDTVLWSLGTAAKGFSPTCPPLGSPFPAGWCSPDWSTELGGTPTAVAKVGTGQAVYTDDTGTVTLLDVATGAVAWTAELGTVSRPTVVGDTIFVSSNGQLAAFPAAGCGAATCTPDWTADGQAAIAAGDVVYSSSDGAIVAYDADGCDAPTCEPLATFIIPGILLFPQIVDDGRLFAAGNDGRVVAYGLP